MRGITRKLTTYIILKVTSFGLLEIMTKTVSEEAAFLKSRAFYSSSIESLLASSSEEILGFLAKTNTFSLDQKQKDAWLEEIRILKDALVNRSGYIFFEYSIPRMGKRIDAVLLIGAVVFVLEFKVGEKEFKSADLDQVWDYALDLKHFHETSHNEFIAPILISTAARSVIPEIAFTRHNDKLLQPIKSTVRLLDTIIDNILTFCEGSEIVAEQWAAGSYRPTPTIIEAALALYSGHSVQDISRQDAEAINLGVTSDAINQIISSSREDNQKAICFVTGVPGAGKTLVGLNVATQHINKDSELYSVFLSGNGPLVTILCEALARDRVERERENGNKVTKKDALREAKMFVQNVHQFRDDCLVDMSKAPIEHVAIFDEAQRAWNKEQTSDFMRRKRGLNGFDNSEPEFLISCMNRHLDWAVIVCLVGGGQEINTGEAGIKEWIDSVIRLFPDWSIYISSRLTDQEYATGEILESIINRSNVHCRDELHLAVSMRSFRAENVSLLIKQMLDIQIEEAKETLKKLREKYPIVITRDLKKAKAWLKMQARGTERYGIVVSSQAERLKPHAIDVKTPVNPIHWFLGEKDDVRSSYYLEDVATEFQVQGLELDWACVTWDADFRYSPEGWDHWSFCGNRWNRIRKPERQIYLKNAYRVLLTRARQGMVIVVPEGDAADPTRDPIFYDPVYEYLANLGFEVLR